MSGASHENGSGGPLLDVASVLASSPFLVVGVGQSMQVRFAAGDDLESMPAAHALCGDQGSDLLSRHAALFEALQGGLRGESASTVFETGPHRVAVHARPLSDQSGAVALCVDVDATEQACQKSDQGLRMLFRQVPAGIWATDAELRVTQAAGSLLEHVPKRLRPVVGRTVWDFVGSRDPEQLSVSHHLAALAGRRTRFRYPAMRRLYDVVVEPLRDASGTVTGSVGFAVDITEQLEREERLQRSERRLESAQRLAHVGNWEWDIAHNRVQWSDELHRIFGLEPGTFEGTYDGFIGRLHPDDRASTEQSVLEALRAHTPTQYDHRIVRADGAVRMLQTRCDVTRDDTGAPRTLLGSCVDVTERWEALEARERTVSLLTATLESTADGVLVVDLEGHITAWNERFREIWPFSEAQMARRQRAPIMHAATRLLVDPEGFLARLAEIYGQPESESHDELRFLDGRIYERYSRPQRLDGTVVGRVWSFRDITERTRLLQQAMLLADASRLLASLEGDKAVEAAVRLALPALGCSCTVDLLGDDGPRRLATVTIEADCDVYIDVPRSLLSGHAVIEQMGNRTRLVVPLFARDSMLGLLTFGGFAGHPHSLQDLELARGLGGRVAMALDQAALYRQARDALAAREEFLSVAAHELRGPATTLKLGFQSLQSTAEGSPARSHVFDMCQRQLNQLGRLVDEMLDFTRLRSQRMHFDVEEVDLSDAARVAVESVRGELTNSGSAFTEHLEPGIVGRWDAGRLEQLVRNLLSNAIKYGRGEPIELLSRTEGDEAVLVVRDHGIGIPADRRALVFEPFERAVSNRNYGGLGLGLFICKAIVEAFGGRLVLESEEGVGSTFTARLSRKGLAT